jgi:mono/diheme cytochrome c family protein
MTCQKRIACGTGASIMASLVMASVGVLFSNPSAAADDPAVKRGQYLVQIGGCNDCHTAGFKGAWGTTYAANLRLTLSGLTEDQWVTFARVPRRPPMPWFNLRDMSDTDLRAMYRFIRELGPKGERAPAAAAPGVSVNTPVIVFEPRMEQTAKR